MAKSSYGKCGDPLLPGHARIGKPHLANLCFNVLAKLSVVVFVFLVVACWRQPESPTRTFQGPGFQKHHQRSTRKPPEKEERIKFPARENKKSAFPSGPLPIGPPGPPLFLKPRTRDLLPGTAPSPKNAQNFALTPHS